MVISLTCSDSFTTEAHVTKPPAAHSPAEVVIAQSKTAGVHFSSREPPSSQGCSVPVYALCSRVADAPRASVATSLPQHTLLFGVCRKRRTGCHLVLQYDTCQSNKYTFNSVWPDYYRCPFYCICPISGWEQWPEVVFIESGLQVPITRSLKSPAVTADVCIIIPTSGRGVPKASRRNPQTEKHSRPWSVSPWFTVVFPPKPQTHDPDRLSPTVSP